MRPFRPLVLPLALGLALGCAGTQSATSTTGTGGLTLSLGSDSFPGYAHVWVSERKLEGSLDGATWTDLGALTGSFDLMALQNGNSATLLAGGSVAAGTYHYFRITWAAVNYADASLPPAYVETAAGLTADLGMPTTTVVAASVAVAANGSTAARIMLSGQQAVQARTSTSATSFTFQATGQAYDLASCARVTGHAGTSSADLEGVEVFVETVDSAGTASILRRAASDAAGAFVLEALPTGGLYYVVAQPASAGTAYPAVASSALNADSATTYPLTLSFASPSAPGTVVLTVTPASGSAEATWAELRQSLSTGGVGTQTLITRAQTAATSTPLDTDGATFTGVYPGSCTVTAQRSSGTATTSATSAAQAVAAGASTSVSLAY